MHSANNAKTSTAPITGNKQTIRQHTSYHLLLRPCPGSAAACCRRTPRSRCPDPCNRISTMHDSARGTLLKHACFQRTHMWILCMFVCVCTHECMYERMCVCKYVCMYVCMVCICMYVCTSYVSMHVCMYEKTRMHLCGGVCYVFVLNSALQELRLRIYTPSPHHPTPLLCSCRVLSTTTIDTTQPARNMKHKHARTGPKGGGDVSVKASRGEDVRCARQTEQRGQRTAQAGCEGEEHGREAVPTGHDNIRQLVSVFIHQSMQAHENPEATQRATHPSMPHPHGARVRHKG